MRTAMTGEDLVFHNFLAIGSRDMDVREEEHVAKRMVIDLRDEEGSDEHMRASCPSSGHHRASSDHSLQATAAMRSEHAQMLYKSELESQQGKRRDLINTTESFQDRSHLLKASRIDSQDDRRYRHQTYGVDDLHPINHPCMASDVRRSSVVKANPPMFVPNRSDNASHVPSLREKVVMPQLPPADEGSRTGLKGSGLANLLNDASANPAKVVPCPSHTPNRMKLYSQNGGLDATLTSSKQATSRSRQLTIFYGGQAHVFDDMPSDKVDAIMTLAGSSGRSWSMVYSPRPKASLPSSGSALSSEAYNTVMSTSGVVGEGSNLSAAKFDYESISLKKQDIKEMSASTAGDTGKGCT